MSITSRQAKIIAPLEAKALWNELGEDFLAGPAQTANWFSFWQSCVNADCLVAALFEAERPVFLLPLEIVKRGPVRIAAFPGGPHANCNFPALAADAQITAADLTTLFQTLHKVRPDIDVVSLVRQLGELDGKANPLMQLQSRENANISLGITLDRDFETVVGRHNAKRKKKKHRQNTRRFEEAGGYRIVTATTPVETTAMLNNYFECKAARLAKAGIKNTYEPAGTMEFFQQLFAHEVQSAMPRFQLKALEAGGQYRAVLGKSYARKQTFIDFIGITEDELVSASPGEFLFFEDIQDSCKTDLAVYSFGIGDEPYKRSWSDIEVPSYDTDVSLTAKGRMFAGYLDARGKLVRRIKKNETVWAAVKKARSRLFGKR
ncbi:GNAT family N-acetyltransferase [Phyllobacterium bourgognense]|uniref:CelD/BcsL family acetyltransferase involved in cellulose biosynthesis n=1 Tax=Phyllobacterium bourgognense TaxID=314236 RepID=A0A368YYY0_9HYPH|nr:GNAT family N-acetyltransferase [Phyllobacterium bourgognense]RCW85403.1 CelD/BcsL family acetyltransferase involved in cellulose biosynthesis [Phyllobacterium bourgognense]